MATTKEFHDYIVENLQKVGDVATRKMMGEYCVYYQGKLIGDICDNCLYVKPTESVLRLMPDADRAYPYEGSKTLMAVVENVEDTEFMEKLLSAMVKELPEPKKKTKKAKPQKEGKNDLS
ncbi:MAG: competence protein TfoX [Lachnospiraceae bacterium]|nr:competence protein TfoX [Lachnospiraceae bacterium]